RERPADLGLDVIVSFTVMGPALGVPDEREAAIGGSHRGGDITGMATVVGRCDILRPQKDRRALYHFSKAHQPRVGRCDTDIDAGAVKVTKFHRVSGECLRFCQRRVHLPIADEVRPGHAFSSGMAAMPGSILPSRNSNDAPPPVEM